MFRSIIIAILLLLFGTISKSQNSNYKQLLDSATNHSGLFIGAEPSSYFHLSLSDSADYKSNLQDRSNYKISPCLLTELLLRSEHPDTTFWTDAELDKSILVKNKDEYISSTDVLKKIKISDKKQAKFYRKKIREFNNTESWDKDIFYFSRPVFDSTKQFAIICFNDGHSGLSGGGAVTLYHFESGVWLEVGFLTVWRY